MGPKRDWRAGLEEAGDICRAGPVLIETHCGWKVGCSVLLGVFKCWGQNVGPPTYLLDEAICLLHLLNGKPGLALGDEGRRIENYIFKFKSGM